MKNRTARVLKWAGIVVVCLGVLYAVLLGLASHSLRRAYRALEADGRPMRLTEIIPPAIPDAENAALMYQAAALLLKAEPAGEQNLFVQLNDLAAKLLDEPDDTETTASFRELLRNEAAVVALETIQRGTLKPGCRHDLDYSQGAAMLLPHLAELRSLSRILCATARVQAAEGDHAGAWRTVIMAMRLADAVKEEPILISQLVRMAQLKMAVDTLQAVATSAAPSDSQNAEAAALLKSFDDPKPLIDALDGERMALGEWFFGLSGAELRQTSGLVGMPPSFVVILATFLRPLFRYDHAAYLGVMHTYTRNAAQPYAASDGQLGDTLIQSVPRYCVFTRMFTPALSQLKSRFVAASAQSRVTRAGLAVLRYREEHGTFPESLAAVNMQTLTDPFSQGRLIYRPDPGGFTVYSVGMDMTDDGGMPAKQGDDRSGDIVWQVAQQEAAPSGK